MTRYNISLLIGDGIGLELSNCVLKVLENIHDKSSSLKFDIHQVEAGDNTLKKRGTALPQDSFDIIKKSQACLKSPVGESAADVVLVLRRYFDLYANIRPSKNYPNIESISKDVDLVTVRENTEDLYLGWEFFSDENTVISLKKTSRSASERISEYAFKVARSRKSGKVTLVHKANVLRKSDNLFIDVAKRVAEKYPEISLDQMYVDACAMDLIRNPNKFDVILTSNLFGDILSDEAAQVTGSLGLAPAANIGEKFGMFEPVHGAAFDIAGKNIANPISFILAMKMMMEWIGEKYSDEKIITQANKVEWAINQLFISNIKTIDIGGRLTTTELNEKFLEILGQYGYE